MALNIKSDFQCSNNRLPTVYQTYQSIICNLWSKWRLELGRAVYMNQYTWLNQSVDNC